MSRKRFTPEQIIGVLREAEVRLSWGRRSRGIVGTSNYDVTDRDLWIYGTLMHE